MRIVKLTQESKKDILNNMLKRSPNNYGTYEATVNEILANVKENGDQAVFAYTKKFDRFDLNAENIRVTPEEIKKAYEELGWKAEYDLTRMCKDSWNFAKTYYSQDN